MAVISRGSRTEPGPAPPSPRLPLHRRQARRRRADRPARHVSRPPLDAANPSPDLTTARFPRHAERAEITESHRCECLTLASADLRGNPWVFDHDFFLLVNVAVGRPLL